MDDPDVILGVDAEADRLPEHPVVRQRLRPHRIDLEPRRLEAGSILRRPRCSNDATGHDRAPTIAVDERRADQQIAFLVIGIGIPH